MKDLNTLIEDQIKELTEILSKQLAIYGGKLPFHIFNGKADENEKITIYEQALKDVTPIFRKSLKEIAQATIEAIKVEMKEDIGDKILRKEMEGTYKDMGFNYAITEQDQKAKQFLGDKE